MTPRELMLTVDAHRWRLEQEYERDLSLAYLNAAWYRSKKMPRFETITRRKQQDVAQTPEQMLAMVQAMHAAMGGKTVYKGSA